MVGTRARKTRPNAALGEMLSSARTRRKLLLPEISKTLNIPLHQLQALEEGDFSVFSAEIYARGACMKYAAYVGIETHETERAIWRALSDQRQTVPLKIHTAFSLFERIISPRSVLWAAIAAVVLMVGGYIIWQVKSFWQLPALALSSELPAIVSDPHITIAGTSEAETRITVNTNTVILKPDATFEVPLLLHKGINVVRIEAQNAAGRKSVIERHLLLPRTATVASSNPRP